VRESGDELSGRTIVLTGATGGIGRALARRLARGGATLLLAGRRPEPLEELAAELGAEAIAGDVTAGEFVAALRTRVQRMWGVPDVLINNAGAFELAAASDTDPITFERVLAVNLRAPFELVRTWLADMISRGSGHIVNIGSVAGRRAYPGNAAYAASKFGLRGLHEVLVEELRGTGVRVTWVEPSAVDTPLWDRFDPDARADLPCRAEMLEPSAVAEAVHFALAQPPSVTVEEIVIRSNSTGERG
jgi:NADP-dependent 3-hydroxy acid dehydrogenase YdfG